MSDPLLNAVLDKNAAALQGLFDNGVQLTVVEYKHKNATKMIDASVWTQCILSNWKEGAQVLTKNLPHMNNMEMILLAIRSGSSGVLRVLWEHLDSRQALEYTYDIQQQILRSIMGGIGQIYNETYQIKDMESTINTLVDLGVDLSGHLQGDYEFNDFRPEGHSIWTRALSVRQLRYVENFWPTWDVMQNWPRLNEMIFQIISFAVGDEAAFNDLTYSHRAQDLLLKFLRESGSLWLKQVAHEPEPNLFKSLNHDGGEIIEKSLVPQGALHHKTLSINRGTAVITPTVLEFLFSPLQFKPSGWLRLPLHLPAPDRQFVWQLWEEIHVLDHHHTWLNLLSSNPSEQNVEILKLVKSEMPEFWAKYWYTPDASGVAPDKKWKGFDGEVFYE